MPILSAAVCGRRAVDDLDPYRTESQKEWKAWADHGYRKLYQPRSMLWFGGIFFTLFFDPSVRNCKPFTPRAVPPCSARCPEFF